MYISIDKSNVTYGAETWKFNKHLESKLMLMEMNIWGIGSDVQDYKKVEIMLIEKKMDIKNSVLDYIRYKQLNWYGHVQRIDQERLPKRILDWCPPGRRRKGRPRN